MPKKKAILNIHIKSEGIHIFSQKFFWIESTIFVIKCQKFTFIVQLFMTKNPFCRPIMCSLAVSTQDSPAVEPRSNPGSGKILMSENLRLYTTSPVVMC